MHPFTGPWQIVKSLEGASYELEFVGNPSCREKKHASDLSPYPPELIPFQPLDTADSRYSQLYRPIGKSPYKEAGINGFTPPQPFRIVSHFLTKGDFRDFHFPPSLSSTMNSGLSLGLTTKSNSASHLATMLSKSTTSTPARHHLWPSQAHLLPLP
jgi:hypothetical protein